LFQRYGSSPALTAALQAPHTARRHDPCTQAVIQHDTSGSGFCPCAVAHAITQTYGADDVLGAAQIPLVKNLVKSLAKFLLFHSVMPRKFHLPSNSGLDKNSHTGGVRLPSVFVEIDGPCRM
jgi:hypothetical protein